MEINITRFEQSLMRKDKKDLYCRPLTALIQTFSKNNLKQQPKNVNFLAKPRQSQGYTTRFQSFDKKAIRNIRSASLYESLGPHLAQDKKCKFHIVNNTCIRKIFYNPIKQNEKRHSVYNLNQNINTQIIDDTNRKENIPKYHCKKLKAIIGKNRARDSHQILKVKLNANPLESINASVIGVKLL